MMPGDQVLYNWGSNTWLSATVALVGENALPLAILVPNAALQLRGMQRVDAGGRLIFVTAAPAPYVLLPQQKPEPDGAGVWMLRDGRRSEFDFSSDVQPTGAPKKQG